MSVYLNTGRDRVEDGKRYGAVKLLSIFTLIILGSALIAIVIKYFLMISYTIISNVSFFNVKEIHIKGVDDRMATEILALAGIETGKNIWKLNPKQIKNSIKLHKSVVDVAVKRSFPDKIYIFLEVRRPYAIVLYEKPYYIDSTGRVIKQVSIIDEQECPIITGISRSDPEQEEFLKKQALYVLDTISRNQRPFSLSELSEVHFINDFFACLYFRSAPFAIKVYLPELETQLKALKIVHSYLRSMGEEKKVALITPFYKSGVAVAFRD